MAIGGVAPRAHHLARRIRSSRSLEPKSPSSLCNFNVGSNLSRTDASPNLLLDSRERERERIPQIVARPARLLGATGRLKNPRAHNRKTRETSDHDP